MTTKDSAGSSQARPNVAVGAGDRGTTVHNRSAAKKTNVGPSSSTIHNRLSGSRFSVLEILEDEPMDAAMPTAENISEVEVLGVIGSTEDASTLEMEGVSVGVSHENLTAGLRNLHKVASVTVGETFTFHVGPTEDQDRPMKDITNSLGTRPTKLKSGRSRASVARGPYSKEDAVPKRAVNEDVSGVRAVHSKAHPADVQRPAQAAKTGRVCKW